MKAFVTGGSGFIGRALIPKLIQRGYEVVALARSEQSLAAVAALGATPVRGDILDVASMRPGMDGSDLVFHLAGWYQLGAAAWQQAEPINVGGTRNVLSLAHELGVPKIVYASTVAVFGDTEGEVVDESYHAGGPFLSEYDRTKWLAHYKVAVPLIEKGAPIVIVMPGGIYGPGDHSVVGEMMHLFYRGVVPALPGPETTLTYAHVDDVAEGFILAAEKGKVGESYVLAGPAIPLGEMVDFWSQLTGRPAPPFRIPARFVHPLAPLAGLLEKVIPVPQSFSAEAVSTLGASYAAQAEKAHRELGWRPRSLQAGMLETFAHIAATAPVTSRRREHQIAWLSLAAAGLLFVVWLFNRRGGGG